MGSTIIFCFFGIFAVLVTIWLVICAFMESEATSNIVAAIIVLIVACFFFTLADAYHKDYINANNAQTEITATEYEREV